MSMIGKVEGREINIRNVKWRSFSRVASRASRARTPCSMVADIRRQVKQRSIQKIHILD